MPRFRFLTCAGLACALLALGLWLAIGDGAALAPMAPGPIAREVPQRPAADAPALAQPAPERLAAAASSSRESTTLELRTVHADGTPAADVALAVRASPRGSPLFQVTTDARGEARVPHAREALLSAAAGALLEVAALGILPEPPPVLLDPRRCFAQPTILALPPLAALELRVLRANGAPLETGAVEVMTQAEHGGMPPPWFGVHGVPWQQQVVGGIARFPRIQAEVPLFVGVQDVAWQLVFVRPHPGLPRGERTVLELRFDQRHHLTRARAIDGRNRTPLANHPLQVSWITVEPTGSASSGFAVTTDEHGCFYFVRTARANAVELWIEIGEPHLGHVRSQVPLGIGAGLHDLGDVVIQPFRPRVSGRVVDAQGTPVPRAEVAAHVVVEAPEDTARLRFEHLAAHLYADDAGRFAWNAPPVSSDHHVAARAKIALTASDATRRAAEVRVSVGTSDVELRIDRLGGFQGRVEHDPRVPFHVLVLEHRRAGGAPTDTWTRLFAAAPTHLEVHGLEPGHYDFRARLADTEEAAALVSGIEVRAGEQTLDPRLDPLDLRTAFAVFDFAIAHPPDCVPLDLRFALTRVTGGGGLRLRGSMVSATRAATLAPAGTYDAVFEAPGFHPVRLLGITAGQRVALQPKHALRLNILAPAGGRGAEGTLELVLRRAESNQEIVRSIDPASQQLVVALSQPGRYDLVWRRRVHSGESSVLVPLGAGEPAFLEVAPTSSETTVQVAPPR
ncbi:MAG: hypothetical protein JNK49_03880 [Planctomycetes bacterium]|nr:hypothetical protein [Planctomycetota bacterium]